MIAVDECRALLAETRHHLDPQLADLARRVDRYLDDTAAVAECTECGQDVPVQFGATAESSQINLRTLLGRVKSGVVSVEEAAELIESWPAPGGAS